MREIEFKGKDKVTGEWRYGYYYSECGCHYIFENRQKESMLKRNVIHEVIPETVGQFTELLDRNGKRIYEGDILEAISKEDRYVGKIVFLQGTFILQTGICKDNNGKEVPEGIPLCDIVRFEKTINLQTKIIGTIHDNPELLKEAE